MHTATEEKTAWFDESFPVGEDCSKQRARMGFLGLGVGAVLGVGFTALAMRKKKKKFSRDRALFSADELPHPSPSWSPI